MALDKLIEIKEEIEKMDKSSHLEVFNILDKEKIPYNSNMNGIFINLSLISTNILKTLEDYIDYKKKQKLYLNKDEIIKEEYREKFFN